MASEFLICPNCKTMLDKPLQYQASRFVSFGSSDTMPCSACGFRIKKMDIIKGKHDARPGVKEWVLGILGFAVMIVGALWLLARCSR